MHFIDADAALRLSADRCAELRRDAELIRTARDARRRRRLVSPPVTPRPGGGIAA